MREDHYDLISKFPLPDVAPKVEMTKRGWCAVCGKHVYAGDGFPCGDAYNPKPLNPAPDLKTCPILGQVLEDVPVSAKQWDVFRQLPSQGDPGDEDPELVEDTSDEWPPYEPPPYDYDAPSADIKSDIAFEAVSITNGARKGRYGTPERNFERIADFWNAYLRQRFPDFFRYYEGFSDIIEPRDVPAMMRFVKEARLIETPDHRDSYTDLVGYALCQAEIMGAR